ncbi:hypothetical protein SAMN04488542_1454 [Fontibacillus panacisegetis]|uniref:Uncharacterized protein n=1 Tax=Fontibacillus panacisegetis TaxID=670482 RepID=A0A1G7UFF1_9BACL|nr:hypothetical protein [Fontibacillus panacisegetis]SDG46295.1 hypothetical protein SAMN04488542_1454 [Fontibacillus panacisegetis]
MTYVRNGWSLVRNQFPSVIILFLYQLLWGLFLYRVVNTAVTTFLSRYPDPPPSALSKILFILEGQYELLHNSEIHTYFWLFIGMVVLRMLLTPFFQAGILYGLTPADSRKSGLTLFRGMKEFWRPVLLFFLLEIILISLPLLWILPKLYALWPSLIYTSGGILPVLKVCGYLLGWFSYCFLIRQCLLFMQFGYLFKKGAWGSLWLGIRHILPGIVIFIILGSAVTAIFLIFGSVSWIWTGLLALILQQAFPFFRCLFNVWGITSQFQLWYSKSQNS